MLLSLAFIFLLGMMLGKAAQQLKLPSLLGMLFTGILLGPHVLNLLDERILSISTDLRQIALIIILSRAGLNLDIKELRKVGRPAILLCFVPASFEIIGMMLLGPRLLGIGLLDAAILGTVIAAVSPAVVVPGMLRLIDKGYGTNKQIPQMIMAGASVDDIYVIVLFTALTGLASKGVLNIAQLLSVPTAILLGIAGGIVVGVLLAIVFTKYHLRDTSKVIIILSFSFLLVTLEQNMKGMIGFSGFLATMAISAMLQLKKPVVAKRLSLKFSKLWVAAEVLLFVLVGASVNIQYAYQAGLAGVVLIGCVLVFRMIGVFASVWNTKLSQKEQLFVALAYMPKATVQAAIGGIPLAMGLAAGETILTIAVLSIIITAPLGALLIERTHQVLLVKEQVE